MITLSRPTLRSLSGLFRRPALGVSARGATPPLVLLAEGPRLRARCQHADLAVEYLERGDFRPLDCVALPLAALPEIARARGPVVVEAIGRDEVRVRRDRGGVGQDRRLATTPLGHVAPFPEEPVQWTAASADLLDALREAAATSTGDSARYALDCIQLRGDGGRVVASDGRQLLVRSGFPLPWADDVLIPASPIFGAAALPRDRPPGVGRTGTHVGLRLGPWTLLLAIRRGARFPDVERVVPDAEAAAVRLRVDPGDASFLAAEFDRLAGETPATIDLNGRVCVRLRDPARGRAAELVLSRSGYTGEPTRIATDRGHLARALRLGFGEIEVGGADAPLVCRSPGRIYAWQPLSADAAIQADDEAIRLDSAGDEPVADITPSPPRSDPTPMNEPPNGNGHATAASSRTDHGDGKPASLSSLIRDAEALHRTLSEARTSASRLIAGLRKHRRKSRLLGNTLRSLRQLRLTEVAE